MSRFVRNTFVCCVAVCGHIAHAKEPLVIRGDQSISLLSDIPLEVSSSHEIFSVRPRLSSRDELTLLLGNAELFIAPPVQSQAASDAGSNEKNNADIQSAINGEPP